MEALETATLIDISPLEFWELTPLEFTILVKAYQQKMEQRNEEKIILAYVNALWTAQWFSKKKPPRMEKLLNRKQRQMTPEEMLAEVRRINAMFGGKVQYSPSKGGE